LQFQLIIDTEEPKEKMHTGFGRLLQEEWLKNDSYCSHPTGIALAFSLKNQLKFISLVLLKRIYNREIFELDTSPNEAREALLKSTWTVAQAAMTTEIKSFTFSLTPFLQNVKRFQLLGQRNRSSCCPTYS